jgi:hypothetical protein
VNKRAIPIIKLSTLGRLPDKVLVDEDASATANQTYTQFTIPPSNANQHEAIRAWVSTHQSMFLVIGAASTALLRGIENARISNISLAKEFLDLATHLRNASSIYTCLPTVTREIYESYVRPAMMVVRPSFSGVSSRESIIFAKLIKELEEPANTCDGQLCESISACRNSDATWWRMHREAMLTLVGVPVSLAQSEYQRQVGSGEHSHNYNEFLRSTLQSEQAMDDYDHFFGCLRGNVGYSHYWNSLSRSLEVSDEYVDIMNENSPTCEFRRRLIPSMEKLDALLT